MTNFDPTTNRIPFVLLTPEEQAALKAWPHGFEFYQSQKWYDCPIPFWSPRAVYRGKPAPAKVAYQDEAALYEVKCVYTHAAVLEALLREAQSELHLTLYEHMWTKRMELCRRIDAALKGEQQ